MKNALILFSALATLLAACSSAPPAGPDASNVQDSGNNSSCSTTCNTCCTSNNECFAGNPNLGCGLFGNPCQICSAGEVCVRGVCSMVDAGGCTPTCDSTVTCGSPDGCGGTCMLGSGCTCNPVCTGVACGTSNGCGGTCVAGSGCTEGSDGCVPKCTGVACGSGDGCGGTCQSGSGCSNGDGCTPMCQAAICGAGDGCGGTCMAGSGCCTPVCTGVNCGSANNCGTICQNGSGCTAVCASPVETTGGWGATSAPVGNACSTTVACPSGYQCLPTSATAGVCFRDCTFDGFCPGDAICLPIGGGQAFCLKSCGTTGTAATCPTAMACNPLSANPGDPGVCFPLSCATASDCNPAGSGTTFTCGTTGPTKGACLCGGAADCNAAGSTVNQCGSNGGCYTPCTTTASCDSAGAGGCCLTSSTPNECESFTSLDCSQIGCASGFTCQGVDGGNTCVAGNGVAGCTLTTETVSLSAGDTQLVAPASIFFNQENTYTFSVASGSGGWTIIAQGPGTGLGIVKIVDPTGTTLWDWNNQPAPSTATADTALVFAPFVDQGTFAYTFPNTATSSGVPPVTAGSWSVTLGSNAPGNVTTEILQKNLTAATGRKIDVDFWVVSNSYTASSLQSAPGWMGGTGTSSVIASLNTGWGHAGIALATVTYHDVSSTLKSSYATIDSTQSGICVGLNELFQLAVSQAGTAQNQTGVNFFLVDTISGNGGNILGIDGAIPGPGGANGTPVSGAIAALDLTDPGGMGHILAHEGGHFLGLFHTTEIPASGATTTSYDPITDSPGCAAATMTSNPAACPDYAYMMFPSITPGQNTMTVSPEEGTVMRAAPSVY
jgi:hypothetical protein